MQKIETKKYHPGYNYKKIISDLFYRRVSYTLAIGLTLLYFIYAWFMVGGNSTHRDDNVSEKIVVLDLRTGYNSSDVVELFESLGDKGLDDYRRVVGLWDNIYAIIYTLVLVAWYSLVFKHLFTPETWLRYLNIFPILLLFADWLENTLEVQLIDHYYKTNTVNETLTQVASSITIIKWVLLFLIILIFIAGLTILIIRKVRRVS